MTTPLLDRLLWWRLPRAPTGKSTLWKGKTITAKTRKTNPDGSIEFVDAQEKKVAEEKATPIMTYDSLAFSAQKYNMPQLIKSKEEIAQFQEQEAKRAEEAEKQRQAAIKTYQKEYAANAAAYHQDFGKQIGGVGLISQERREEIRRLEAKEKAEKQMEKARIQKQRNEILKTATGHKTPGIKTYPHAYD